MERVLTGVAIATAAAVAIVGTYIAVDGRSDVAAQEDRYEALDVRVANLEVTLSTLANDVEIVRGRLAGLAPKLTEDELERIECIPDLQRQIDELYEAVRDRLPPLPGGAVERCDLALEFGAIPFGVEAGTERAGD